MDNRIHSWFFLLLLSAIVRPAGAALSTRRYQHWLWYDQTYANILHLNCSAEYENYLNKYDTLWYTGWPSYSPRESRGIYWTYTHPLVNCLLDNASDLDKSNMASAGVLLGLAPTILAYAGSHLGETTLLASRRPLLSFMLAIGSPAVPVLRTFQYGDVHRMLIRRSAKRGFTMNLKRTAQATRTRLAIVVAEYVFALAAIVNVILASYELGMATVLSWSADVWFHLLLFSTVIPGVIHIFGVWAFWLDVEREEERGTGDKRTYRERLRVWAQYEFKPCAAHGPTKLRYRKDSYLFEIVSWWTATGTLSHFIYGTVAFASVLFICVPEALKALVRYLASALCCRIIVMYELSGMREASRGTLSRARTHVDEYEEDEPK